MIKESSEIFNRYQYEKLLKNFNEDTNYYGSKKKTEENKFWFELLKLSKYRCYYCGEKITINNYEREHRIDKALFSDAYLNERDIPYSLTDLNHIKKINLELKNSKYNLVPCCRECNQSKKLNEQNSIRKSLIEKRKSLSENQKLFNSISEVDFFLTNGNNYLTEKLKINFLKFSLEGNDKKNYYLNFRKKILEKIEKLIEINWIITVNPTPLEEILINFENRDYLIFNYRLDHFIFHNIILELNY